MRKCREGAAKKKKNSVPEFIFEETPCLVICYKPVTGLTTNKR